MVWEMTLALNLGLLFLLEFVSCRHRVEVSKG
jgi:hypothetical protein